jgi:hypothetical protein
MDLLKLLRAEHSKKQTDRIVHYIGADKDRFALLMKLFLQGEYRITQRAAWPLSYGRVMSVCFDFVQAPATPIAVKAFSLSILGKLSADYPGIRSELKLIIEEQWEHATPAFRSRARKILKSMGD